MYLLSVVASQIFPLNPGAQLTTLEMRSSVVVLIT
jgi:hypothetical protein